MSNEIMQKDTVLITGVAGFIGSHIAKHCLDLGFKVIGIDNLSGGFIDNVPDGVQFYEHDIIDDSYLDALFDDQRPKFVFHIAADARENLSHFAARHTYINNIIGSTNIINACVTYDVKCLVFTSSIAVMANGIPPYTENEPFRPLDPYGSSKMLIEMHLNHALEMFGLNSIIFRPYNCYGPGQNIGDKYRNVIGIFMNQIMQGKPLTVFGDGTQSRAFSYIDDVAPHIANSVLREDFYNHVFYVGGSERFTINEIIGVIGNEFGVTPLVKYLPERHEAKHAYALTDKFQQAFNPQRTRFTDGIHEMAEWAKRVGPRESKEFSRIEIRKNLPEGW